MNKINDQNSLFAELAGRALLQPEFREAVLKYPDVVLGQAGLIKDYTDKLVLSLSNDVLPNISVKNLPDLFGFNRWGFAGGNIL